MKSCLGASSFSLNTSIEIEMSRVSSSGDKVPPTSVYIFISKRVFPFADGEELGVPSCYPEKSSRH